MMWEALAWMCVIFTVASFAVILMLALQAEGRPPERARKVEAYKKNNHVIATRVGREIGKNFKIPASGHRARR